MEIEGVILKAASSVCMKSDETGDKHKGFVHVLGTEANGHDVVRFEASNGAVVVRIDKVVDKAEKLACIIPKGTIGRLRAKDEVYLGKNHRQHKLHVEKGADIVERDLDPDDGNGKSLPEAYPDLDEKFDDLPSGSGGFDVHPLNLAKAARICDQLKLTRVTIRTAKRKGANYAYLVGYKDEDLTCQVAIGCLDMFGAPEAAAVNDGETQSAPAAENE